MTKNKDVEKKLIDFFSQHSLEEANSEVGKRNLFNC